jgi:AcrR family transcriptional regulator
MPGRRERNRSTTTAQIKRAALDQIAQAGAANLSIRGVARQIGMSPAGLYRYYDGLDALLTELLADAYNALADAVTDAARSTPGPPITRLRAAILAYRGWAVANPQNFMLIFGTPVPGYQAPPEGPTVAANRRMGEVFFELTAQAWASSEIRSPDPGQQAEPTPAEQLLAEQLQALAAGFPATLVPQMMGGWGLWHGLVTLEVTGQLDWIYPDASRFFASQVDHWLAGLTAVSA